MKKYHYATLRLESLLELSRVPAPKDSYTANDAESQAARHLLNSGYRLHSVSLDLAIFEREFDGFSPKIAAALGHTYDPLDVMRELLDDAQVEFGERVCDCRPEPENDGHVCAYCKARSLLGMFRPPHPEQLPQEEDPRLTTTLPEEAP